MADRSDLTEMSVDLLPVCLYRADDVRSLDRTAIDTFNIPGLTLMERAGSAAFELLKQRWPEARILAVVCGAGNNGGDGYVVARLAKGAGLEVTLYSLVETNKLEGDALTVAEAYQASEGTIVPFTGELGGADIIVDGVFGTGLERDVTGIWAEALEQMNTHGAPILALDMPSGLHSDRGVVMATAVQADATISFIGLKQGAFTGQAADYCGDIYFHDLDVPAEVYKDHPATAFRLTWDQERKRIAPRSRIAHKGDCGHVLLVGGNLGMSGAIRLAGEAAARSGAGLTSVATRENHAAIIVDNRPELMCRGTETISQVKAQIDKATAIGIGPGLGTDDWALSMLNTVLETGNKPLVLDADALNLLALEPMKSDRWVLTPHPGEAARLLGCSTGEVQRDRFTAIKEIQRKYGGVVVLKGAGTLVLGMEGPPLICTDGNPGMASGGMGDLLTGIVTSLMAQGASAFDAAAMGVALHAKAGDLAAQRGERGLLASDLIPHIRKLINP